MNNAELKLQIEELKLLFSNPKLFIKNYFGDLINEFDIRTTKYEIEQETKKSENEEVNNDQENNLTQTIDVVRVWRELMIGQLKNAEQESLQRITHVFLLDFKLKEEQFKEIMKAFEEKKSERIHEDKSLTKCNKLEQILYEHSNLVKKIILGEKCFFILNTQWISNISKLNFGPVNFWSNIFPIIQVNGKYIDKKGQHIWK